MGKVADTEIVSAKMQQDIITVLRAVKVVGQFYWPMSNIQRFTDLEAALQAIFWQGADVSDEEREILLKLINNVASL